MQARKHLPPRGLISFILIIILSNTILSQQAWQWINPKPQGNDLFGVYFINRDTGFCVGDVGTIMRTSNGGATWDVRTCGTGSRLLKIYFPKHAPVGYAVGDSGTILKTTNAGETWFQQQSNDSGPLLSVHFPVNDRIGYAAGAGAVLKTTNGGDTWTPLPGTDSYFFTDVWFVGNDTGWALNYGGVLIKTTDGGNNWVEHPVGGEELHAIQFPTDTKTGFVVGGNDIHQ